MSVVTRVCLSGCLLTRCYLAHDPLVSSVTACICQQLCLPMAGCCQVGIKAQSNAAAGTNPTPTRTVASKRPSGRYGPLHNAYKQAHLPSFVLQRQLLNMHAHFSHGLHGRGDGGLFSPLAGNTCSSAAAPAACHQHGLGLLFVAHRRPSKCLYACPLSTIAQMQSTHMCVYHTHTWQTSLLAATQPHCCVVLRATEHPQVKLTSQAQLQNTGQQQDCVKWRQQAKTAQAPMPTYAQVQLAARA